MKDNGVDKEADGFSRVARRGQRFVIRTSEGPLRHVWRAAYAGLARGWALWLRGGDRRATAFVRRSVGARAVRYGVSDIDLAVVVPADPGRPGRARERVLSRHDRLLRALPSPGTALLDRPMVLESDELAGVARMSSLTASSAVYFGPRSHQDRIVLHDLPGLRGPTTEWRRVSGPARALPRPTSDRARLCVAAWLALQALWRLLLQDCPAPARAHSPYFCLKLVAEPARIWLALSSAEFPVSHREILERALPLLPEEERAIRRALWLERRLTDGVQPPLAEFLGYLVGLSDRIAAELERRRAIGGRVTRQARLDGLGSAGGGRRRLRPTAPRCLWPTGGRWSAAGFGGEAGC